jgi:hypothetical protein
MMITSGGDEPDLRDGKDLRRLALTLQVGGSGCRAVRNCVRVTRVWWPPQLWLH